MRSTRFRLIAFALLAVGLGTTLLFSTRHTAAQPVPVPAQPTKPGAKPDEEKIEKISFPENKQVNEQFRGLMEYADSPEPNYKNLFRVAQLILDAKSDYFFLYTDGKDKGERRSVKEETNRIIGTLKKDGLEYYQNFYGPDAENLLRAAKDDGYDRPKLAEIAQRYYHTKAGAEAARLLAALYLESGNYPEAAYSYRRLLARPDADAILDPRALFRAAVALRRANDGKPSEEAAAVWDKLEKKFPREGVQVGRKVYSVEQLKAELDRPVTALFGSVGSEFVAGKGGDNTRTATADAGVPFLQPEYTLPVLYPLGLDDQSRANDWVKTTIDNAYANLAYKSKKTPLIPACFPVTAPNMIIFRGYDGVYAFYTKDCKDSGGRLRAAGDLAWYTDAKWGAGHIARSAPSGGEDASLLTQDKTNQEQWNATWTGSLPGVVFENPLAGSLSHDGKRVYFVDDFNIPPGVVAQMNEFGGFNPGMQQQAQGGKVEYNKLVAVDLETGMLAWSLGELASAGLRDDEDKVANAAQLGEGAYFLGPPVTVNGKLYVLLERDGALKLACFDPSKESPVVKANAKPGKRVTAAARQPELVWVQNLGRANTPIKQDAGRRFQGCFLAVADGVMVCPTNSGAIVAVDLNARSLLWAHTYASLDAPSGPRPGQPFNPGMATSGGIKDQRWRASAPMITGGRVLVTAYDSGALQCLDLRTGKLKWEEKRKPDDLYVGGVIGDKVLVVGRTTVRALKIVGEPKEGTDRERALPGWETDSVKIATPVGHGVVGKDGKFYLPVIGDADKPDDKTPGVLAINGVDGKMSQISYRRKDSAGPTVGDPRTILGNLVFHDGLMFSQSATEVMWFQLNEVKQREAKAALEKNPNDPVGLLWNGELTLERGELKEAVALFKMSEANKPDEPTAKKLKNKLYDAYTQMLRTEDFGKLEGILDEYKKLCEFELNPDDPVNYARQLDEQIRRRGLYYNLLADGREKQGRLTDAFDAYRAYAGLGEKNKMLPVPEDPNTLALPEVWAGGRIDAMMRKAKDPAARKPLEDKVAKEWAEVKGANDLNRLRAFVKAFGPYFANGREAQFLLAEKLTATNDDANRREAQDLLLNLVAQAEDDRDAATAATATEALARVLTDRGMTDDALGLYRRIAERFPTSAVREGKTGADLLGELIADKRYLPSLESDRPPAVGKYKVEAAQSNSGTYRPPMSSLGLVTDGGAMSFYKRNRVTLDYDVYGQGVASVVVTDRVTNKVKLKSEPMPVQFYNYNSGTMNPNAGLPNQKLAQVSGHLLLLHTFGANGTWVQCFDLSTGSSKPLWKVNLHGATGVSVQGGMINNWVQEVDTNTGDMTITPQVFNNMTGAQSSDLAFKLGRSMVLQPNYATVLTKDGMTTRDPRTGSVLWQRGGVAQRAMVFGDARHVFLVEPQSNGFSSRVFRAVDGVQLPKVPDFGEMAMGKKEFTRLHILGRSLLVLESTGKDKPKLLRLYDCLEGKDVWSKEYPADSAAFDTLDPELTGMVSADGKIDILSTRTGTPLHQLSVDAKKVDEHVKDAKGKFNVVKPLLMADADRFYVFLNRPLGPNMQAPEQTMGQLSPTRVRAVNGAAYAFDRGSGKRLWYMDTELSNQRLIVERFDDLPCLLLANPYHMPDPNAPVVFKGGGAGVVHKIAAIDKANGAVREMKDLPHNGNWLQGLYQDEKTGAWEFGGVNNQQRIVVTPLVAPAPK